MTPHIVEDEADAEWIKQVETQRMSWCLADVINLHGEGVVGGAAGGWNESWDDGGTEVIYPDRQPTAPQLAPTPDTLPTPATPQMPIAPPVTDQSQSNRNPSGAPLPMAAEGARPLDAAANGARTSEVRLRPAANGQTGTSVLMHPAASAEPPRAPGYPIVPARYEAGPHSRASQARYLPPPAAEGPAVGWQRRAGNVSDPETRPPDWAHDRYPEMRRLPSEPAVGEPARTSRYSSWQETYAR